MSEEMTKKEDKKINKLPLIIFIIATVITIPTMIYLVDIDYFQQRNTIEKEPVAIFQEGAEKVKGGVVGENYVEPSANPLHETTISLDLDSIWNRVGFAHNVWLKVEGQNNIQVSPNCSVEFRKPDLETLMTINCTPAADKREMQAIADSWGKIKPEERNFSVTLKEQIGVENIP